MATKNQRKLKVGILGATGSVGQRFVQLLENHPWFEISTLVASEKSARKKYQDAVQWKMNTPISSAIAKLLVKSSGEKLDCDFLFSGLDSSVAGSLEEYYAQKGYPVISNSKNHRMDNDVPLLIPEVNFEHIKLISTQKKKRKYTSGFILTNPNCSAVGLTMAMKPLHDVFEVEKVTITTMQALSGAGFPGISSMDSIDNVIPFIKDEEEKLELEPKKILGKYKNAYIQFAGFSISSQCNRVNVIDGHTECVSVKLNKKTSVEKITNVFNNFLPPLKIRQLPSAPKKTIIVYDALDRPQPRLDRDKEHGMAVHIGRIRPCNILDFKFVVLSHNTIRGAVGGAILNAELLYQEGYLNKIS